MTYVRRGDSEAGHQCELPTTSGIRGDLYRCDGSSCVLDRPAEGGPEGVLPVGTWVTVDLSSNLCQDGEIVGVIGAALGGVWEYEVRVRGGDVITTQPTHVRPAALDAGQPVTESHNVTDDPT
jgi:hypothetical protein